VQKIFVFSQRASLFRFASFLVTPSSEAGVRWSSFEN
jgi:hypothetical protein